ncbi:MAG: ABC transporter permease subunit [Slackia sp.]|nr:ABC transporter permease subunit [Slackia sp.]
MTDTTPRTHLKRLCRRAWPIAFWLVVWHIASVVVGHDILLVSPIAAAERLIELAGEADFWLSIGQSLSRIALGFIAALVSGTLLAAASSRFSAIFDLLAPLVAAIKAVPVASFVILVLIWVSSEHLSVIISFLMVFPIVYTNMLEGIRQTDRQLLEMADVFEVSAFDRLRFIYCSQALPYFQAACSLSLGMCWKAGIAAEVIGLPEMSIGEHLYEAKVYLDTADLFAWTIVIICISIVFEKAFKKAIDCAARKIERMS